MAQSTASAVKRRFYRQTFEILDNKKSKYRHTLLINPEDMTMEEPNRATVTQTLGGAYLSLFGQGLQTVNISGKTGFAVRRSADGIWTDGYQEIKSLRKNLYRYFINSKSSKMEMRWYNWEDEEYYRIVPLSMRIQRNVSTGPMYRYEIQFICIGALGKQKRKRNENMIRTVDALSYSKSIGAVIAAINGVVQT